MPYNPFNQSIYGIYCPDWLTAAPQYILDNPYQSLAIAACSAWFVCVGMLFYKAAFNRY